MVWSCIVLAFAAFPISAQGVGETLGGVGEVADTIKEGATREFEIQLNLFPSLMNQSIDNSEAEDKITDQAYHFELSLQFESDKKDFADLAKSTHAYYGLSIMKYINSGSDWADSTAVYAFVYGHRYYGQEDYQGLGYGWFVGGALWSTSDAYYWEGGTLYEDEEESGINPVAAAEFFYKFQYNGFVAQPRLLVTIDREFGEILFYPQLMIGAHF